jgi:hypothetical protein
LLLFLNWLLLCDYYPEAEREVSSCCGCDALCVAGSCEHGTYLRRLLPLLLWWGGLQLSLIDEAARLQRGEKPVCKPIQHH